MCQLITAKSEIPNESVPHHAYAENLQLTNYILNKELMLSKITTFDDRP